MLITQRNPVNTRVFDVDNSRFSVDNFVDNSGCSVDNFVRKKLEKVIHIVIHKVIHRFWGKLWITCG